LVKEIKKKNNNNPIDVLYIGHDLSIYDSLKTLSSRLETFFIEKTIFSQKIINNNQFFLIDDSIDEFEDRITFLQKKNFKNFFILLSNKNLKIYDKKDYKVFFKPLKIFELHREIYKKISKNIEKREVWKLDRSKLKFYKNDKVFVNLTEKEFYFIFFLLHNKGVSVTKKKLLNKVWNIQIASNISETRVVETLVSRIRSKFKNIIRPPIIIKDEIGYRLLI
tara:strand:+ start:35 stop:700 length:666 start_codon:yes stop_codon:yes gene_type:complete